jgi:CBS domain-containing protein
MQETFARVARLEGRNPEALVAAPSGNLANAADLATVGDKLWRQLRKDWPVLVLVGLMAVVIGVQSYLALRPRRRPLLTLFNEDIDEKTLTTLPMALVEKRQKLLQRLARLAADGRLADVRVREIMSLTPETVSPRTPVTELATKMQEKRIRHVLVCDEATQLLGIISDRDVGQKTGRTAADIMTTRLTIVPPEMEAVPAITIMMNRGISALPVVSVDGGLLGIITTTDVMLVLQCVILLGEHRTESDAGTMAPLPGVPVSNASAMAFFQAMNP